MERRSIAIHGTVQGVGFRPFVHHLASRLRLHGFVTNNGGSVEIEVEGDEPQLEEFIADLTTQRPPLSHIDDIFWQRKPLRGESEFHIKPSVAQSHGDVVISPDIATCDACLAELFNPLDRRHRYPFLNCTNCGPRLTIITGSPYDRGQTTMADFPMCAACRAEYEDPCNRRFHAQPVACPICGPQLSAFNGRNQPISTDDPLASFIDALHDNQIGALKGLGGYHLACDATNAAAVDELRRRKHRDDKPFAIMVSTVEAAASFCELSAEERNLLMCSRRPIVLLKKRPHSRLSENIAPGNPNLGIMLPYTPLHHLLMQDFNGPLVMTSGNRSDEPIATSEPEVFERLSGIADIFLTHNRRIHVRCDDSVTRVIDRSESPIRRSRGYSPQPLRLPLKGSASILAAGGQLKNTFALARNHHAILSHHLGDLDHFEAYRAFEKDIALYERLFGIHPEFIAHDLHPDYASTRYAQKRAAADNNIKLIPVQHHHAHMASCMAENNLNERVIAVCFDGTGYGTDGSIWGGEFLIGDFHSFRRAAHLRRVPLPGGDKAIKEPWRMALAHLTDANAGASSLQDRIAAGSIRTVERMLAQNINAPLTSSAGRLFDAVASLIGLRDSVSFEGQAAIELESLARNENADGHYPFSITDTAAHPLQIDTRALIHAIQADLRNDISMAKIARRFHTTLVEMVAQICIRLRDETGLDKIVLTGGCFMNALLLHEAQLLLQKNNFSTWTHRQVPPNDGGVSLGQIAIAASQIGARQCA